MIHSTAIVSPAAVLAPDVHAGPYAIIEEGVEIGPGCRIEAHAQVLRGVKMGARNTVGHGAVIGGDPQSLGFDTSRLTGVRIGDDNIFREHVTIHRSAIEGGQTAIGSHNFIMGGCHVGHDAVIGDQNVMANHVLLAGHVTIGNRCFLGGAAVFHQFIRVGDLAMVQGNSSFSKDIPPFCTGFRENRVEGLNVVGLRRAGFDSAVRLDLKRAWTAVIQSALGMIKGAAAVLETGEWSEPSRQLLEFISRSGNKGVAGPGRER